MGGILEGAAGFNQLALPTLTVTSVLALAFLMNYCGATATLGLAFSATGSAFPFFSSLLGWIGVFLTGSDTSSNALFGNLQVVTANRLGFDPVLMAAANSSEWSDGKDDQPAEHRDCGRSHWPYTIGAGKALSLHFKTQCIACSGRWPCDLAVYLRHSLLINIERDIKPKLT